MMTKRISLLTQALQCFFLWIMPVVFFTGKSMTQVSVNPPSYLMYVLVNNMTEKAQFYAAEAELKRLSGFQKLDCRDFPPEFLTVYAAIPLSKESVKQALAKAGVEVFELCADDIELERAIYRRNQVNQPQH